MNYAEWIKKEPYTLQAHQLEIASRVLQKGSTWLGEHVSAGLGKTLGTASPCKYIHEMKGGIRLAWICPNHLVGSIRRDFRKFAMPESWEIIPYTQAHQHIGSYDIVVFDECHYLKNLKQTRVQDPLGNWSLLLQGSRRAKACYYISKAAKFVFALSATPYPNDPTELWGVLMATNSPVLGSYKKFDFMRSVLGCPIEKAYWTDMSYYGDPTVSKDVLWRWMQSWGWYYKNKDGLALPPMTHVEWEWSEPKLTKAEKEIAKAVGAITSLDELTHVSELSRLMITLGVKKVKSSECESWLESIKDGDDQWVIFYRHNEVLAELEKKCLKEGITISKVCGGQSQIIRDAMVSDFTVSKSSKIIFVNIAASEGLNLQCASKVAFFELPWNPKESIQSYERIHRIGQTEDCTSVTILASETDRHIHGLLSDKSIYF